MSKVKIQGNASGTGVVTLTAPNTNTDRTITLPDGDITLGGGVDGIVSTANATAITIDASENVGIGTSSPSQKLHVEGAGTQFIYLNNSTTNDSLNFKAGNGASSIQTNGGSNVMNFFTGGSERMRITSDGRGLSQFTAKAWINFNGAGTVAIRDSHNCSSITDHSTGNWTVVYTNAIGANNCVNGYCKASAYLCQIDQPTTANTANVRAIHNDGTVMDVDYVSIIVFGD